MPWISRFGGAERADTEWSSRGLEPEPVSADLREQLELDADAGRITWAEAHRRAHNSAVAKAAREALFAEAA